MVSTLGQVDDGHGSSESRATSIDGQFEDPFDNEANLTLRGDAAIYDGELIVDRTAMRDEFDRFPLAPWQPVDGTPRISQGVLLTNGTEMSNSTASVSIDQHDLQVTMDLSRGQLSVAGPTIILSGSGPDTIWATYDDGDRKVKLMVTNTTGTYELANTNGQLIKDEWYTANLMVEGSDISLGMGPAFLVGSYNAQGNFSTLTLGAMRMDNVAWDNVTVSRIGGAGTAISKPVNLPADTFWTTLKLTYYKATGTDLEFSLVDPANGLPFMGLDDITSTFLDLEDRLDPMVVTRVQLKIRLTSEGTATPSVSLWRVTWEGDPPKFIKPIPSSTLDEDVDRTGVIDLRQYFEDRFTDRDNLTFSIPWVTDAMHVQPVVDGHWLGFELPTKDWYGVEYYKVRASDGVLSVDSAQATVVVNPIDDPPLVRPTGRVDMFEDEEHVFNITPFLEDVDTPVGSLKVRALSDHATVDGQFIHLNYDAGGTDRVELEISDYNNHIQYFLDVQIQEVNDPPVFDTIDQVAIYEDTVRTLDLSEYVSDEDDPIEELMFDLVDGDRYISLEGHTITLLYNDTGGDFEYIIVVSDEKNSVNQSLKVSVQAVNDPPIIVSVGDMTPVDGRVTWSMTEGNTSDLLIEVYDEESRNFQYTLVTDLEGAAMVGRTLRIVTDVGQIGLYNLQVSVSDGKAAALVRITVSVTNRNDPVQDVAISEPKNGTRIQEGTLFTLKGYAFDPDFAFNQELTYTWRSNIDGPLGEGKNLEVNLTAGDHRITLNVTDGEYSGEAVATMKVTKKDGGGGGGGGGGDDGGGDSGGISPAIVIGIVIALVVVAGAFIVVRARGAANPNYVEYSEPPQDMEDIPLASEAFDEPKDKAVKPKIDEAAALYGSDYKRKEAEGPAGVAPAPKPQAEEVAPTPKLQSVAIDTKTLAGDDPEQLALDQRKRDYQAAISALPFGVPSSELAHMDWYELAKAMAEGDHMTLDDGRTVVLIEDNWYYADIEDTKNFLRKHA